MKYFFVFFYFLCLDYISLTLLLLLFLSIFRFCYTFYFNLKHCFCFYILENCCTFIALTFCTGTLRVTTYCYQGNIKNYYAQIQSMNTCYACYKKDQFDHSFLFLNQKNILQKHYHFHMQFKNDKRGQQFYCQLRYIIKLGSV